MARDGKAGLARDGDLAELERKAFRSMHQDGLMEIFLGILLISMGISGTLTNLGIGELPGYAALFCLMLAGMAFFIAGKKRLTVPRMGMARFDRQRKKRLWNVRLVLTASVCVGLLLWLAAAVGMLSRPGSGGIPTIAVITLFFTLNVFVVFGIMAHFMDYPRLWYVAILFALTIPLNEVLEYGYDSPFTTLVAFGVPGAAISAMGAYHLADFLRRHPLPMKGAADG